MTPPPPTVSSRFAAAALCVFAPAALFSVGLPLPSRAASLPPAAQEALVAGDRAWEERALEADGTWSPEPAAPPRAVEGASAHRRARELLEEAPR